MEQDSPQEIIDVHCHCFAGPKQAEEVRQGLTRLSEAGVRHLAVMGLVNPVLDGEEVWKLIPEGFENLGDPMFNEAEALLELRQQTGELIFPLLDTRMLPVEVTDYLVDYRERGFRGIKGLYLADAGNDLRLCGVPHTFGISLKQYQQREWAIFAFAEAHGLPVVYHMDANRYGDVMRAILDDFPQLRINFPHFGIGRRAFSKILDRYPNVYTDIAYMRPHMEGNPQSYADFIRHYPDRVCFGSDALLYQPEIVLDYIDLIRSMPLSEELQERIFSTNPLNFLGLI